jgi:hypothetical protein
VKEFIPVADVEPRVREIYHRDDFKNLPSEQQTALKVFLDTIDEKIKDW